MANTKSKQAPKVDAEKVFSMLHMVKKGLKYAAMMAPMVGLAGHFSHIENLLDLVMMSAGGMGAIACAYNYMKFKVVGTPLEKYLP